MIYSSSSSGQVFSFNTRQLRNQVSTEEGSPADDDSYLGYSVATGEFTGDDDMDIAVGMPRGANLTGKVIFDMLIFTEIILHFLGRFVQLKSDQLAQPNWGSNWSIFWIQH